jgi:phage/plasmid primase-like uncharacterized protein
LKFADIKRAAQGRWLDTLSGLGVDVRLNKHSPCLGCGGKDRFRFDDRTGNGDFICNQMDQKSGDGFTLLQHVYGWSAKESFDAVADYLGLENNKPFPVYTAPKIIEFKPKSDYALNLWKHASGDVQSHPYAVSKHIGWEAGAKRGLVSGSVVGKKADCIIIPIREFQKFEVVAVQCINREGKKQTFGALKGNGFICGNTKDKTIRWFVVEGWADAISMVFHHYHGNAVAAAALGAYNVQMVLAERLNTVYDPKKIIVIKDKEKACGGNNGSNQS